MKISGFQSESFQDWIEPGKNGLSSVIFTGRCNYRCPGCYAGGLIKRTEQFSEEEILRRLERKRDFIQRVVICGGEATLEIDLLDFLKKLKAKDFSVKLDTNGSNPWVLEKAIEEKLVDYIAMDIKGPRSLYGRIVGFENEGAFEIGAVESSARVVQNFSGYEFRTTFVPIYRDAEKKTFSWMTSDEVREMVNWVAGLVSNPQETKWFVQQFTAKSREEMMDARFSKENLSPEYHKTPENLLREYRTVLKERFLRAELR